MYNSELNNKVISLVKAKDLIVTADLKYVFFFHFPAHPDQQALLSFKFQIKHYKWTVLPFGHCYFVRKMLISVITYFRSKGIKDAIIGEKITLHVMIWNGVFNCSSL